MAPPERPLAESEIGLRGRFERAQDPGFTGEPSQENLFTATRFCGARLSEASIYRLLYREGHRLFPDEAFTDLFRSTGRNSVPPRIVATVMALQRVEGLSDRDAVDRFAFDLRWKYAAGGLEGPRHLHRGH